MNIACFGDSWTYGWEVERNESWPGLLDKERNFNVINLGDGGLSNFTIYNRIEEYCKDNLPDTIIVGWSGVTRYHFNNYFFDFCWADDYKLRNKFFKNKTLNDLENDFLNLNEAVNDICKKNNIKLIKFSVFGDFKYLWDEYYTDTSFLDFLSKKQGHNFQYEIPFFEYDFLSEINFKNTSAFAKKYFSKDWQRAILERNEIRPGEYFLDCGHPNQKGHIAWAEYIKKYL